MEVTCKVQNRKTKRCKVKSIDISRHSKLKFPSSMGFNHQIYLIRSNVEQIKKFIDFLKRDQLLMIVLFVFKDTKRFEYL